MAGGFNEVFQVAPAHPISEIRRQRRHALTVHGTRPSPVSSRSQRENEGRIAATGAPLKCPRGKFFPTHPVRPSQTRIHYGCLLSPIVESHKLSRSRRPSAVRRFPIAFPWICMPGERRSTFASCHRRPRVRCPDQLPGIPGVRSGLSVRDSHAANPLFVRAKVKPAAGDRSDDTAF